MKYEDSPAYLESLGFTPDEAIAISRLRTYQPPTNPEEVRQYTDRNRQKSEVAQINPGESQKNRGRN